MLLDKLNYLHPQQDSFRLPEKQISSLYSKSYRNLAPTTSILKHNMKPNSQSKLSIAKTKLNENKENMQESFARRYMHGFDRRNWFLFGECSLFVFAKLRKVEMKRVDE